MIGLLGASLAVAQDFDFPGTRDGHPDLNGIWQTLSTANWNLEPHAASQGAIETLGTIGAVPPGLGVIVGAASGRDSSSRDSSGREGSTIPYLPAARAQRDQNFASRRTNDPEAKCFLPGVPRATYMPHPLQILQTDDDIMILYEYASAVRTVFMNEEVPAIAESWMGWSNGRWDGDTLVVDVTAQNGQTWLDRAGNYGSATMHVVERYTPLGPNHLQYEATIEDPNVYSRPWTISMPLYRRLEPNVQLLEFKCVEFAEELMYGHLSKGEGQ